MLESLEIRDFALIEQIKIDWSRGLNIVTGETGAGKSIVMDALSAVLGGKVGPQFIRIGAERARIEATFAPTPRVEAWLKSQELVDEDSKSLNVSREITKQGSKVRINGTLVNHSHLHELRSFLITVHAQHEARTLMSPQSQLEMLDSLGTDAHRKMIEEVRLLHLQRKELLAEISDLEMSEQERTRRLDFASFQLEELTEAHLTEIDEDEKLSQDQNRLGNARQLEEAVSEARMLLNGEGEASDSDNSKPALDSLQEALSALEKAERYDSTIQALTEPLKTALFHLEETVGELRRYRDSLDLDPEALNDLESRLSLLTGIKKKYGPTLESAIATRDALRIEVDNLTHSTEKIDQLKAEEAGLYSRLLKVAESLSASRQKLAESLATKVEKELKDLGMERAAFHIQVERLEEAQQTGLDRLEFLIAPNPGQPPMSLSKIASGGELSRMMLAVKSIFARGDHVPTVIFDEIDTGMSGKALQAVRDKLTVLSKSHQILCITHQPIIAAVADNHLEVSKKQTANQTNISVRTLAGDDRLKQLAQMASGEGDTRAALDFARALVAQAQQIKPAP
ncbi:MAG: DNA repair protein RecN [Leptolyngbya sp.]|nr:DNA repair protein RecN [Candidatus Melainabacteria bacterium]